MKRFRDRADAGSALERSAQATEEPPETFPTGI